MSFGTPTLVYVSLTTDAHQSCAEIESLHLYEWPCDGNGAGLIKATVRATAWVR